MARRRPADDDADDDDRPKKKKKKKAAPVEEVEDEGAVDELDELDEEAAPAPPRPRENAYTGLLVITFLSLAVACGLLYSDFSELSASPVQPPSVTLPSLGAMPQPATPAPRGR
jgi:hypothetical protein